jgi:hypothetical protein
VKRRKKSGRKEDRRENCRRNTTKECEKKRKGKRDNFMRRIKIGHQKREHGVKREERIKHKNKKQIKTERWYSLMAGRKRTENMMKRQ